MAGWRWLLGLLLLLCALPALPEPLLRVAPDERAQVSGQHTLALVEPDANGWTLAQAQAHSADFRIVGRNEPNMGSQRNAIWMKIPIISTSGSDEARILLLATNFMTETDVWLEHDGAAVRVLRQSTRHPFGTRPIAFHQLAAPFALPPGHSIVWIRYRSEGSTAMPLSIETPASFLAYSNRRMASDFAIYGIIAACALAGLVASAITRRPVFLAYAAYTVSVMAYIMQREGHAFRFLWPDAPVWNEYASLPLGLMLVVTAALFTRSYLELRRHAPRANHFIHLLLLVQLAILLASAFMPVRILKEVAILSTTFAAILFLIFGLLAMRRAGARYIFYVLGWFGFVFATVATVSVRWAGIELSRAQMMAIMNGAMMFDALMMGMALVGGVILLRRERDQAMRARMAAQENSMNLMQRMGRLERNYEIAQVMAEASNRALADTGHDLRQPLFALRSAMSDLARPEGRAAGQLSAIEQSLDYMEQLVEGLLASASSEAEAAGAADDSGKETFAATVILEALAQVHGPAADAAGKRLRMVPSRVQIHANPLALLRTLGNLVANAIQHGSGDTVLLGARQEKNALRFEVYNRADAVTSAHLSGLQRRYARGAVATSGTDGRREDMDCGGLGLGLAIVANVAGQHDLPWSITSQNSTVVARLWAPRAAWQAEADMVDRTAAIRCSSKR